MSSNAMDWAEKAPTANIFEFTILAALAGYADDHGRGTIPDLTSIAQGCRCELEVIRQHLADVADRGLVVLDGTAFQLVMAVTR